MELNHAPVFILASTMPAKRSSLPAITHLDIARPTKRAKPASRAGEKLSLLSRRGNELIQWFPEIAAELAELPDIVIEGELVMLDARGHSEFQRLRGRCAIRDSRRTAVEAKQHPAAVFAFDLLAIRGADLRTQPLLKRKAALRKELRSTKRICYCQHIGENGERLFAEADRLGLEGIIAKKADSPYRRGLTPNWVKIKTMHGRHIDEERAKWNDAT